MATILDKDLTRETTIKVDGREIQITLTEAQTIHMKLKGMKSGALEIGIEQLYKQLNGGDEQVAEEEVVVKKAHNGLDLSDYKGDDDMLISLYDIRAAFNIASFGTEMTAKIDGFLSKMISERKERRATKTTSNKKVA